MPNFVVRVGLFAEDGDVPEGRPGRPSPALSHNGFFSLGEESSSGERDDNSSCRGSQDDRHDDQDEQDLGVLFVFFSTTFVHKFCCYWCQGSLK